MHVAPTLSRTGPGVATDGRPRFDLARFDDATTVLERSAVATFSVPDAVAGPAVVYLAREGGR